VCNRDGDPGLWNSPTEPLYERFHYVQAGEEFCVELFPANAAFPATPCQEMDTFCIHINDNHGWMITSDPQIDECFFLDPMYGIYSEFCVRIPQEAEPGTRDSIFVMMRYCDVNMNCIINCLDLLECVDPNIYTRNDGTVFGPYYSTDTIIVIVE
jgi:hypothetical protein